MSLCCQFTFPEYYRSSINVNASFDLHGSQKWKGADGFISICSLIYDQHFNRHIRRHQFQAELVKNDSFYFIRVSNKSAAFLPCGAPVIRNGFALP
jgi:hypothetical protein